MMEERSMDICLIYASTSGNVEIVMETIADVLQAHKGISVELLRAENTPITVIEKNSDFIFGTSTWEHGALNPFFSRLYKELQSVDCTGKEAAFVGLGDVRYEPILFCEGMKKLERLWEKQGGTVIGNHLTINGEPYSKLQSVVTPWTERLLK